MLLPTLSALVRGAVEGRSLDGGTNVTLHAMIRLVELFIKVGHPAPYAHAGVGVVLEAHAASMYPNSTVQCRESLIVVVASQGPLYLCHCKLRAKPFACVWFSSCEGQPHPLFLPRMEATHLPCIHRSLVTPAASLLRAFYPCCQNSPINRVLFLLHNHTWLDALVASCGARGGANGWSCLAALLGATHRDAAAGLLAHNSARVSATCVDVCLKSFPCVGSLDVLLALPDSALHSLAHNDTFVGLVAPGRRAQSLSPMSLTPSSARPGMATAGGVGMPPIATGGCSCYTH
jgi:hypothetical protein